MATQLVCEYESPEVTAMLAPFGFELRHTGGNCWAYILPCSGDAEIVVTWTDDPTPPAEVSDPVLVAYYPNPWALPTVTAEYESVGAMVTAWRTLDVSAVEGR